MRLPTPSSRLLMIDDLARLRQKLTAADGDLATYWRNYLELAASEPIGEFQSLPPLAWLITGEARYARATREVFLALREALPLADASVEAQLHPYTAGAPMARFAIFLDWIWESDILTAGVRQDLAGQLITQVYSHCFLRLKGRVPAGDNQQASMAYACAVTGYVFGVKRGASPAARQMYREGMARFEALLTAFGDGGWCGEGSTYHHQVMSPILALFTAFVEQVTGVDWFDRRVGSATVREALQLSIDTINGAGMLPGWDQYGNCAPELKVHLAYQARKTGSAAPLQAIARHGMWSENELLAWYTDDKVWTLVFWPDQFAGLAADQPPRSWLNRPVCGKLIAADGSLDLLQMWDTVEAGRPGRAHISPNNVELCSHGALHTADGHGPKADPTFFTRPDGLSYAVAHSVVLVDDLGYEYPERPWRGSGERLVDLPGFQALRGDVSSLYATLWQVPTMKRTSLLLDGTLLLLVDRFAADRPRRFTWQCMLRPAVTADGCRARQRLREGVVLDLAAEAGQSFSVTPIADYPRGLEQQTHRLAMTGEPMTAGAIPVAMRPHPGTVTVAELSAGWSVMRGDDDAPADLFDAPATTDLHRDYIGPAANGRTLWFGRRCQLTAAEASAAERLTVQRAQVDRIDVYVNGVRAPDLFTHPSIVPGCRDVHKPDGRFWPTHFDVRGLLRPGENRIAIASSEFRGQAICGPIRLLRLIEPKPAALAVKQDGETILVQDSDRHWRVIADNEAHRLLPFGPDAETDAEMAAAEGDLLVLAYVTDYHSPTLHVQCSERLHLAWSADGLLIDLLGQPEATVTIGQGDRTWTLRQGGAAASPWPVRFVDSTPVPPAPPLPAIAPLLLDETAPANDRLCTYDDGWLAGNAADRRAALTAALAADDWRTRIGACEALVPADRSWAQPLLVDLLAAEDREDLYPPIAANWPFAKMKITFYEWARPGLPEAAKRRYRLQVSCLHALGRIGDQSCKPTILRLLGDTKPFYPVIVQACMAAGRLRLHGALPALKALTASRERNTRETASHTVELLEQRLAWNDYCLRVFANGQP